MTGPAQQQPTYLRPAEVAHQLRCSEWWIKEQARRGRIPYAWIGGSYLFTEEHVVEIVRLFEVAPTTPATSRSSASRGVSASASDRSASVLQLRARPPRRLRRVTEQQAA
jgi:hypothetical protein